MRDAYDYNMITLKLSCKIDTKDSVNWLIPLFILDLIKR